MHTYGQFRAPSWKLAFGLCEETGILRGSLHRQGRTSKVWKEKPQLTGRFEPRTFFNHSAVAFYGILKMISLFLVEKHFLTLQTASNLRCHGQGVFSDQDVVVSEDEWMIETAPDTRSIWLWASVLLQYSLSLVPQKVSDRFSAGMRQDIL